ncbi:MAG: hypothetical protein GY869_24000 [Planctomycetes bacterium]|nr:hypothetical protein [Planctomycetota bacterium]
MLGIDINDNSIRVISLKRRGGAFVLNDFLEVPFSERQSSDPVELGRLLSEAVVENNWQDQPAVMTIPTRYCFIRYFPAGMVPTEDGQFTGYLSKDQIEALLDRVRQSMIASTEQLIFDLWIDANKTKSETSSQANGSKYGVLVGAAQSEAVEFCQEFAQAANINLQGLEIRSLAAINGMLLHWHEAPEENIAVAYLETDRADIAIIDPEGIVSLPSVNFSAQVAQGQPTPGYQELIRHFRRIFNTVKLSDSRSAPQRLFIAGVCQDGSLDDLAKPLQQELDIEVTPCSSWRHVIQLPTPETNLSRYVPALGAALDGLDVSPCWFNFLQPRSVRTEKRKPITWRPFALVGAIAIVIFSAFWFYLVQQKKTTLKDLEYKIEQAGPDLASTSQARDNWYLFRPFVSATQGGNRLEYIKIVGEISRLFPNADSAYVTNLDVVDNNSSNEQVTVTGWVREAPVATDFVNSLNSSTLFKDIGMRGVERKITIPNHPYPVSFILYCNLRRPLDGEK